MLVTLLVFVLNRRCRMLAGSDAEIGCFGLRDKFVN
jgi:hypothetical protein